MLIDLSLPIDAATLSANDTYRTLIESGHAGTHFDVVDKIFPTDSFRTQGKVVDIAHIRDREVGVDDLADTAIDAGDFVIFHTGYVDELGYNTQPYTGRSAELADEAVDYLLARKVKLIGVDAAGVQRPRKHAHVDQRCADAGVFIVENLANVKQLLARRPSPFTVYTAPVPRTDLTGLPCRVIAEFA